MMRKAVKNNNRGFTLIEIMVSVSIFSIIIFIVIGSIMTVFNESRKSQAMQTVMDNLNSTVESMTRTIRFGSTYHCDINSGDINTTQDCGTSGAPVAAANSFAVKFNNVVNIFKLDPGTGRIQQSRNGGASYYYITGSDLVIDKLMFYVSGTTNYSGGDTRQPLVTIVIEGHSGSKVESQYSFSMQTSVSQRVFDSQ